MVAISSLQVNKAAGVDDINSTLLKGIVVGVVKPIAMIFRDSLRKGVIPDDWKRANVVAIFKGGTKKEPGNYRPVSITCQIGKLMERFIKSQLVGYLEENRLIYNSQHRFRRNRSYLSNLLRVYGDGE